MFGGTHQLSMYGWSRKLVIALSILESKLRFALRTIPAYIMLVAFG